MPIRLGQRCLPAPGLRNWPLDLKVRKRHTAHAHWYDWAQSPSQRVNIGRYTTTLLSRASREKSRSPAREGVFFFAERDRTLTCADCGQEFVFTASEQQFYQERGFSDPRRCRSCRAARKASMGSGDSMGGGGGYSSVAVAVTAPVVAVVSASAGRARCSRPPARTAARPRWCRSGPRAASRSTATTASATPPRLDARLAREPRRHESYGAPARSGLFRFPSRPTCRARQPWKARPAPRRGAPPARGTVSTRRSRGQLRRRRRSTPGRRRARRRCRS